MRPWPMTATGLALGLALLPRPATADLAAFLAGCVAQAAELHRVPERLREMGLKEVEPGAGPPGPSLALDAPSRRLWTEARPRGDSFTGLVPASPGRPFVLCWHGSRPSESAAEALAELRRRFPPQEGTTERGAEMFYGGYERWETRVDGTEVVLGVSWPVRDRPQDGFGILQLIRLVRE